MSEAPATAPTDAPSLTPEQAALQRAQVAYDAKNKLISAINDPDHAVRAKLADADFRGKYLAGDRFAKAEIKALIEGKVSADGDAKRADAALAGLPTSGYFTNSPNGVSPANMNSAVAHFREIGISDAAIREALTGAAVDRQTYSAVAAYRESLLRDREWVKEWQSGSLPHRAQMTLCSIIRANGVKG
jgi:hypothetical protein